MARRRQTEFGKRKNNRSRFCSFFFFISFSLSFSSFWKNKTTRGFSIFHLLLTLFPFFAFFLSSLLFALPLIRKFLIHPFLLLLLFSSLYLFIFSRCFFFSLLHPQMTMQDKCSCVFWLLGLSLIILLIISSVFFLYSFFSSTFLPCGWI